VFPLLRKVVPVTGKHVDAEGGDDEQRSKDGNNDIGPYEKGVIAVVN
jgi:hypothetical protein